MKYPSRLLTSIICVTALPALADSSFLTTSTADAFLATGTGSGANDFTTLNFGGAGTLAIAPASSTKGEFDSLVKFNSASAVASFNTTYGVGNWHLTGLTLSLASNFGTQGTQPTQSIFNTINAGDFNVQWTSVDNWVEGTGGGTGTPSTPVNNFVDFDSISTLFAGTSDALGTFTYTPPGNNVYVDYTLPLNSDLVADATAGGDVSLYFSATTGSQVGYLFNSRTFAGNVPELSLTAAPIATPKPTTITLLTLPLGGLWFARKSKS